MAARSRCARLAPLAVLFLIAGCGLEANDDARRGRGEVADELPFVRRPEGSDPKWACPNWIDSTSETRAGGPCLKPLDASLTCATCKMTFRDPTLAADVYLSDVAQIVDEVKKEADAPMRRSLEELKTKLRTALEGLKIADPRKAEQVVDVDRLIEQLKNDKDSSGKNAIERVAEAERLRWEAEKKRLADSDAKRTIQFLKPGTAPAAMPLLLCPNADCKQSIDPAQSRCRECKQPYAISPADIAASIREPLEAVCPWCKKAVDPTSNLCRGCDKLYRPQTREGPCWRCGGGKACPECQGSGNSTEAPGVGIPVCWLCLPQTATGDPSAVRGDGMCPECRGKGFIEYDPALPRDWNAYTPQGRGKWKLAAGENAQAASTKPDAAPSKPEKEEKAATPPPEKDEPKKEEPKKDGKKGDGE